MPIHPGEVQMSMITTRLATRDDLAPVASLFDAYRQFYKQSPDLPLAREFMRARLERKDSVVIVAESARGTVLGFCQLYPLFCSILAAPTYTLYDLFVSPDSRGTGAGRSLMLAAQAYSARTGAARMELSTAKDNTVAQSLYESLGWVRDQAFFVYSKTLQA
jgi:ribosomal protein S18 acetylase RimI-like enzyme